MNYDSKAEEFFEMMAKKKKKLIEIPLNCSQGETGTLLYLTFIQDGISSSELAEHLDVSLPRITSLLNALETKKMVKKRACPLDKRKTIIHITKYGKELVLSKKQEAIDKITKIMEKLDEKDINEYIRISKKIGEIIEDIEEKETKDLVKNCIGNI